MIELHQRICDAIADEGGTPYYVGGCVRDEILGHAPTDWDIEVFGITPEKLRKLLGYFGPVNEIGKSFGVLVVNHQIQVSTPRRDNKQGRGHKGFVAELDPNMSVADAASRRDFTINGIYKNAITGETIDHFGGIKDLRERRLRHINDLHFGEDPLRVLRGMQFVSRFKLDSVDQGTTALCRHLKGEYGTLAVERIHDEWVKWAVKGQRPSYGLNLLRRTGWLDLYPELNGMVGVRQDPHWHPEGQVFEHITHVCDAMASICERERITGEDRETLMFAALTHDMGKPLTTVFQKGRWRSPGHAQSGVPIARQFLKSIGVFDRVIERVLPLVAEHMFAIWEPQNRRTVRRLKVRLNPCMLDELMLLLEADHSGRPPLPPGKPEGYNAIVDLAAELPPQITPLLTGQHILAAGIKSGPEIGRIKRVAFEAQLNEEFTDEQGAIQWLNQHLTALSSSDDSPAPGKQYNGES